MTRSATVDGGAGQFEGPAQRLRASGDIRAVFAARHASASPLAVLHARRRGDDGPARVAVVAGKGVGNAVQRNRAKRRLRAAIAGVQLRQGVDYVVVGRTGTLTAPWANLQSAIGRSAAAVERS